MSQDKLDEEVLEVLSSLILFKTRAESKGWRDAFENMPVYMERIGLTQGEVDKLHVVHVAGTKGKGSTCAMVENMLRTCGYRTGLYTSPHLVDVRERVRINGSMVSKEVFQKHFWECYDQFRAAATADIGVPGYFRFITLLALKIFLAQQVDVVVLEVGIGGRLDATNVIPHPTVCGITSLGFDHMDMLGDTLPKIAREKAGILKNGRPGFTLPQPDDALEALHEVATRVGAPLTVPKSLDDWKLENGSTSIPMSLGGEHQRLNASLAVQLCRTFEQEMAGLGKATPGHQQRLEQLSQGILPTQYVQGLATTAWPGRSQVIHDSEFEAAQQPSAISSTMSSTTATTTVPGSSRLSFYIDGAHTPESMASCAEWFASAVNSASPPAGVSQVERVLLFNCMKERDPAALLPSLSDNLASKGVAVSHALFVPPQSVYGFLPTKKNPTPASATGADATNALLTRPHADVAVPNQDGATPAAQVSTASTNGSTQPSSIQGTDFTWQVQLQQVWESHCRKDHHAHIAAVQELRSSLPAVPAAPGLPPQDPSTGAVMPSLTSAIEWLRCMARNRPQTQLQVLVTGSLYLVGDVLRLLNRAPK